VKFKNSVKILKFTRNSYNLSPPNNNNSNINNNNNNIKIIPQLIIMQDNNNGNSLSNGDPRRSPDRFANIRAAEERKLLARNNGHKPKKIIMTDTNIPIPEDDNEDGDKFSGRESGGTASTPVDADNTDATLLKKNDDEKKQSPTRRILDRIYTRYDISKKSKIPFLVLSATCLFFLLIIIILAIIWPYIPSYMRADVCTDPECFDVSKQVS
jgi:hypothetical protein